MSLATQTMTEDGQPLFTCLSCCIGFSTAGDQRIHYQSDHHRYNMKRRVASLPPISATVFNQKVLQRRAETAITTSAKGATCEICSKIYTTENAYRSHLNSKKHKENEMKATKKKLNGGTDDSPVSATEVSGHVDASTDAQKEPPSSSSSSTIVAAESSSWADKKPVAAPVLTAVDEDADEEQVNDAIDAKIAAARSRLAPGSCLFCRHQSSSIESSLEHMAVKHSFFIPDMEYLVDLPGLLTYLGEKVAVGNVCLFCNDKGREFRTIEAVWKHMNDKGHHKIAYDSEKDRLEISDFYDFSSSYPDAAVAHGKKAAARSRKKFIVQHNEEDEEWEDVDSDDGEEADEVVDEEDEEEEEDGDLLPKGRETITYGDTEYELVLPSGARIGHRALRRYYAQSFRTSSRLAQEDPKSGAAIVRRLLGERKRGSDLVPVKGDFGAFGSGTQVVKARNRGEAKEAGRHIREFRDQKRKEDYKTRVAFVHNNQKHFRDPLLQ